MTRLPIALQPAAHLRNAVESDTFKVFVKNAKDDAPAELLIFDEIGKDPFFGTGIGAKDVAGFLAENRGQPVNVRINSPGGLVYDGLTIYNSLIQHDGPVTASIEGIAASIASVIAMAAGKVRMTAAGNMMIHRAMGVGVGNSAVMLDMAEWLDKIDGQIAGVYAAKTGRKKETMLKYMTGKVDGTMFTADEALSVGLIDEIIPVRGDKRGTRNDAETVIADVTPEVVAAAVTTTLEAEARRKATKARAAARLRLMEVEH